MPADRGDHDSGLDCQQHDAAAANPYHRTRFDRQYSDSERQLLIHDCNVRTGITVASLRSETMERLRSLVDVTRSEQQVEEEEARSFLDPNEEPRVFRFVAGPSSRRSLLVGTVSRLLDRLTDRRSAVGEQAVYAVSAELKVEVLALFDPELELGRRAREVYDAFLRAPDDIESSPESPLGSPLTDGTCATQPLGVGVDRARIPRCV